MMKYKSKVNLKIPAFVLGITIMSCAPLLIDFTCLALILLIVILSIEVAFIYGVRYIINNNTLTISYCGFKSYTININEIKKISYTDDVLSAPAESADRLEIIYNDRSVMVSPKDKESFINQLLDINNGIEIDKY